MSTFSKLALPFAIGLSSASFAVADDAHRVSASSQSAGTIVSMSEDEIRKIDKSAGKVTVKHDELKNLDMPAMTMVLFDIYDYQPTTGVRGRSSSNRAANRP